MAQVLKRVIIPGVSNRIIYGAIENISEVLVNDAKAEFNATIDIRKKPQKGYVETYVEFFPYRYDFIWKVRKKPKGYEVTLDARTAGSWYEFLFDMRDKLDRLSTTQWSALLNFCMGYLTAGAAKGKKRGASKTHLKRAKSGFKKHKTVRVK